MRRRKIIHLYYRAAGSYFPDRDSDYYYLAGWSGTVARRTVEHTSKYFVENWRPEREISTPLNHEVQGVMCRLFPARHIRYFGDYSPSMLWELRKQSRECDILLHHNGIHSNPLYLTSFLIRDIPIVAQHHGDSPSFVRFQQNRHLRNLISHFIERRALGCIDHFFVLRRSEIEFVSRYVPKSRISMQTMGVDFDEFRPIDKELARQKLNLAKNRKIVLYVGKFYRLKGVDIILNAFQQLKRKYDIDLILVGGSPADQLYDEVKSSGAIFYERLPHKDLPVYYSAADVYLLPSFSQNYRGIDVATIESLACGTPIVSTTLRDFPTEEGHKLGKIPEDASDVIKCVSEILDNPSPYFGCRKIAMKYYDWKRIILNTVEVYDKLFDKYYDHVGETN